MLKAIELQGFKSFVDKTRFEFPPGITVIVGPNGSGKSNVVDAIKWVLGEQSARSLRGKEMADVIFKGSGSGSRKPANSAEATIIFENLDRRLEWDSDEVHVTRRVYRSGEGEYLINGHACRLRDIKDLFRGTGVGADAYSLIEQGKVDTVLQASPKERRAIFEEAAGISRFKAKKIESQRRVERVEQNLLRLSDIVDEVSGRLKRLKSQAGKAERFGDYNARLQSLRTQVGQVDWQHLSGQLMALEAQMAEVQQQIDEHATCLADSESRSNEIEHQCGEVLERLRALELNTSRLHERVASNESMIVRERQRTNDLADELRSHRHQLLSRERRLGALDQQLAQSAEALQEAQHQHETNRSVTQQRQAAVTNCTGQLERTRQELELKRHRFVQVMRESAALGTEITACESAVDNSQLAIERAAEAQSKVASDLASSTADLTQIDSHESELAATLARLDARLQAENSALASTEKELAELNDETVGLRQREIALRERAGVLEEIELRMEGIGSGVKEVLKRARDSQSGPLSGVRGMVADLIHVTEPSVAEMIDVALGDRAQHLVVAGTQLFQHIEDSGLEVPGRVGFLRLQSTAPPPLSTQSDLSGQSGVIGRAIEFVRATAEYTHLLSWLLGDTWLVEHISDAIQLGRSVAAPLRFVTRRGELLDRDGRLVVGPHAAALGLMSRRTELRDLKSRIETSREQLRESEKRLDDTQSTHQSQRTQISQWREQRNQVAEQLSSARATLLSAREKVTQLEEQLELTRQEQARHHAQVERGQAQLTQTRAQLSELELEIKSLEHSIAAGRDGIAAQEEELERLRAAASEAEVLNARAEQQVEVWTNRLAQLQSDQAENAKSMHQAREQALLCQHRLATAELTTLGASSENAELALRIEAEQTGIVEENARLNQLQADRQAALAEATRTRESLRETEQRWHKLELEAERNRHERDNLASRLNDDYGITIDDLQRELTVEEKAERQQVDTEIDELRRKISQLGAVNMDALNELQELESRHTGLDEQYRDLVEAKETLERIIHKIDADSRRLFAETLEAIRANFGVLFRKVFGGGRADIALEDDVDILDSGIDIIATPPGKQSLGLSLLSGGERALTAVTLLMAVFQYRPSPFCVLDEVDGPLDEANIGRFIDVLNEFLEWTKFVVVTHSKKTMTSAHTLHGVTMQESGISKRVSVRFEEVGEHGVISEDALRRSKDDAA